jgi:hypothetical protein
MAKQRWPIHRKAFIRRHNVKVAKRAAKRAEQATLTTGAQIMSLEPQLPAISRTPAATLAAAIARIEIVCKLADAELPIATGSSNTALAEIAESAATALMLANALRGYTTGGQS